MSDHTEPPRLRIHPALSVLGLLALVAVGLLLIFALATAVALIIGYACIAAALVFLAYVLIKRALRRRSESD